MKNEKRVSSLIALAIVSTLSFFFFSFKISHAQTIQQPIHSTYQFGIDNTGQQLGSGISSTISNIAFFVNASSTTNNIANVSISVCSVQQTGINSTQCGGTFYGVYQSSNVSFADNFIGVLNIPITATTTNPSRYYFISYGTNHPTTDALGGSTNDVYTGGRCKYTGVGDNNCTTVNDLFFGYSNTPFTNSGSSISIDYPTEGLVTPAFQYWTVTYSANVNIPLEQISAEIHWGTTTNAMTHRDGGGIDTYATTTNFLVDYFFELSDYYAQAFLLNGTTTIATSTIRSFTTTSAGNPFDTQPDIGGGYATTTGDYFEQCNQLGGNFWQAYFCNLVTIMLKPHTYSVNLLTNSFNTFRKVFPFSIFFNLNNIFNDYVSNNPNTVSKNLEFRLSPYAPAFTLLSNTTLDDTIGSANKTILFNGIIALFWVLISLKIVNHFRK